MATETYSFSDWLAGSSPPTGWDVADAVDDGWTKDEIENLMLATKRPYEPAEKPEVKHEDRNQVEPIHLPPTGQTKTSPNDEKPTRTKPASDIRTGQIIGAERFDKELEMWLTDQEWTIRRNLLSGDLELHLPGGVVPMNDDRLAEIRFSFKYTSNGKEAAKDKIADAVSLIGERNAYHPVHDYLTGLVWDGTERIDTWLIDHLGAEDTPLNRAFGRKILCAAVRRVKDPGCKFDHMLILEGKQDLGKSSTISALCHDRSWFTDQLEVGADAKATIEKTAGAWIVELPELDGMGKRDANRVKSFITTEKDRARQAYARYAATRPRQFVLFGTTNESDYLRDTTGNRRFWIVRVTSVNVAALAAIRNQLWAEAVLAEPNEKIWLDDLELMADQAALTREKTDFGPWYDFLADKIPEGDLKISALDAWKLLGFDSKEKIDRLTPQHRAHLSRALVGLGFEADTRSLRKDGRKVRAYVRGDLSKASWWGEGDPHPPREEDPSEGW
ncbi:virulence-associated E family protein [Roseibium algicola]|uniref:virulence-associated E family protein n=1 Tax=Roseibium algicola TaxID=2857014 RepID=UPI0034581D07